jgi:hypothetical protein
MPPEVPTHLSGVSVPSKVSAWLRAGKGFGTKRLGSGDERPKLGTKPRAISLALCDEKARDHT